MKITFFGASKTVTGSKTLLEMGSETVLVDCGMYQGKGLSGLNSATLGLDAQKLSMVFLTHGHLDHCGLLPILVKSGFKGKIISSCATKEIARIILEDSASIQENESSEKGSAPPLYDSLDVEQTMELFSTSEVGVENKEKTFSYKFFEAGHILGASSLVIEYEGEKICFSGDLGRKDDSIHLPPEFPEEMDYLVLESTYGNRLHPRVDPLEEMERHVKRIRGTKGVLLIPSFAVARSQIIIHLLSKLFQKREDLKMPIYFDSPMGLRTTRLYEKNIEKLKITKREFQEDLEFIKFTEFGKDLKKLSKASGPYILIASSGMISGGRVLKHFDMLAKYESNTVLLVGYQGEGTIGNSLLEGEHLVRLFGHDVNVRAKVELIESLSAHADYAEMVDLISSCKERPRKIFLNHGEEASLEAFKQTLMKNFSSEVVIAQKGVAYEL